MKIACIGWGSLIWRPETLLIHREWFSDGPFLPIEFGRKSKDGRLTLVIVDKALPVRTLWALMATNDLDKAKSSLQTREGIPKSKIGTFISSVTSEEQTSDSIKLIIQNWAKKLDLDAVIWTNLPPKYNNINGLIPTMDEAVSYLRNIDLNTRITAEEYIRKAPIQIDTEYRRRFEVEFGWTFKQ